MRSAELLREAAQAIRDEWESPRGGAWSRVQRFHLAVADWLEAAAEHESSFDCEAHCEPDGCRSGRRALAVARAYLGRDA